MSSDATPPQPRELTLKELDEILAIEDDQVRNLRVTQGYYALSHHLGNVLGSENANWCTFAVWASRQAGVVIRGEVAAMAAIRNFVVRRERHRGKRSPELTDSNDWYAWTQWLMKAHASHWNQGRVEPWTLLLLVFGSFSRATSQGNTDVFEDIARQFLPFTTILRKSTSLTDPEMLAFLGGLSPLPARDGGQQELKIGLEQYFQAKHTSDPDERARLMLYGNCCVGYHEQTRLDDAISRAVNSPITYIRDDVVMWYTYGIGATTLMRSLLGWPLHRAVRRALIPMVEFVAQWVWQTISIGWVMELSIPGETFILGRDLPRLPTGESFPVPLRTEALRTMDTDLFAWLSFAAPNRLNGTGARDWTSLPERMNTICNLFRSRQQQPTLYLAPFTPEQTRVIYEGKVPSGPLGGAKVPTVSTSGRAR